MQLLHKALEEKIKKAEKLPRVVPTDLSNIYTKDETDQKISEIPIGGVEEAPIDTKQYGREDGAWTEVVSGGAPEGTAVKSTGEIGGAKFLREDGDGTCSWQTPAGGSPTVATGAEVDTGTDNTKMVTPKAMEDSSYTKLALGETSGTAYRGDRGKTAYDHSQVAHAPDNADNTAYVIFNAEQTTLAEADLIGFVQGATEELRAITYANFLKDLKTYFDSVYTPL